MKIAFNILAILICGVAAYFSLTLKEKFESQQQTRLDTIQTNRNVTATAEGIEAEIASQSDVLKQAKLDRDTAAASLESAEATGRTLDNQLKAVQANIETQQEEIARLNRNIDEITDTLAEFGENVTPDNINQKISDLNKRRDELAAQREELMELTAAAERNLAEKRAQADALAQRNVARNAQLVLNATEAVITAVNHDWGFVLIGAGSNSGFSPQTAMVVRRDGRVIGRVNPSAIEPTQTVAEIDFDTLAPGVRLQPGDRVVIARPVAN